MKRNKILFIAVLILGVIYFSLDRQLFYYDKNSLQIYGSLPMNIKPDFRYDFEGGFAIEDQFGFYLVSKGEIQYVGMDSKLHIKDIIRYGFEDEKLITQIEDVNGLNYYILFQRSESKDSKRELSVSVLQENEELSFDNFKWINVKGAENKIRIMELFRNYSLIAIVGLLFFTLFGFLKKIPKIVRGY